MSAGELAIGEENASDARWLHNCGPSSREVYRTPAIGTGWTFDLRGVLANWAGWEHAGEIAAMHAGRLPATLVLAAAERALAAMGAAADAEGDEQERALRAIAAVSRLLLSRGELKAWVGVARHQKVDRSIEAPDNRPATLLGVACTLAAYGVYSLPLLLWSRPPSLRWFRADVVIGFRQFDGAAGGGAA